MMMRFVGYGDPFMRDVDGSLPPVWLVMVDDGPNLLAVGDGHPSVRPRRRLAFRRETYAFRPTEHTPDRIVYRFEGFI